MANALAALTIGPLEARGDDGILADVKAFSALGLHGAAVATEIDSRPLEAGAIAAQLRAVIESTRPATVKLACPASPATLEAIAGVLRDADIRALVLDPAAASFDVACLDVLRTQLLPLTLIAVPNVLEAQAMTGLRVETWEDMREAAQAIAAMGVANVAVKGGKLGGRQATDLLFDGADYRDYTAERVPLAGGAGTGTTFAAAIAATLAKGETVRHSVAAAKAYVTKALQSSYDLGGRRAPHLFYRYWQPASTGLPSRDGD